MISLSWFLKRGYTQGVFWYIMINVFSATNDVIIRIAGNQLHWIEVSFFRYFFGMIMVLPLMFRDTTLFRTKQVSNHVIRAILGFLGLTACCYAVINMPFSENETIMFTQPFIFLIMAYFLLREKVTWQRWMATLCGFMGLLIVMRPGTEAFRWLSFVPLFAAFSFASLDFMAKKMIQADRDLTLIFYFAVGTTICAGIPLYYVWQTPTMSQLGTLFLLGMGGNLIQVCIYRAFAATEASALMPFRYTSLIIASLAELAVFGVVPSTNVLIGAAIIIMAAFYNSVYEFRKENVQSKGSKKKAA